MERLTDGVELLDGPLDDRAALAGNLRDLRRINRWLGGVRLSAAGIEALAAHRLEVTLLDVGTGGADIPIALLQAAEGRGRRLAVVALDSRPEIVALARAAAAGRVRGRGKPRDRGRRRSLDPVPRPVVRRRPRIARAPPPRARRCRRALARDGPRRPARDRRQRPRTKPPRLARRLAHRPPADRQSVYARRRAALGPTCLPLRRGCRADPGGRPRPRLDLPRFVRPALRDGRGPALAGR